MGTLAVVQLQMRSGLPKDVVTNSFAIGGLDENNSAADAEGVTSAIQDFYSLAHADFGGNSMSKYLSPALERGATDCVVKLYDISGVKLTLNDQGKPRPHGSPYFTDPFGISTPIAGTPEPEEVAIALTFEASGRAGALVETVDGIDFGSRVDRPRQRYTGRVYLGPWCQHGDLAGADANGNARPGAGILTGIRSVASRLALAINAVNAEFFLGVWSRSDGVIRSVDSVRTDNAWDTQRRRGVTPTSVNRLAVAISPRVELGA